MQHQTLLAKIMQKNRYTLIEKSLTIFLALNALLEYLYLHACFMREIMQVAKAAGDYLSSNLMCYIQWWISFAAMGSHCQEHSCSAAIFCYNLIISCEFRIHLTARTIITRLYIHCIYIYMYVCIWRLQ